jgi:probable addiction module antidote protein
VKYLRAALRDSTEAFLVAVHNVVDAQIGMTKLASDAGLHRVNLYRMLSEEGNPRLESLSAVLEAIGMRLSIDPVSSDSDSSVEDGGSKHSSRKADHPSSRLLKKRPKEN